MDFVYWLAAPFCHASSEWRFCAGDTCTALCARCVGLFGVFLIAALFLRITEPRQERSRVILDKRAFFAALAGLGLAAVDALALDSAREVRLLTGAAGGFGLAVVAEAVSAARRGGVPLHLGQAPRSLALNGAALGLAAVAVAAFLGLAERPAALDLASVAGVWGILLLGLHAGLALLSLGTRRPAPQ